MSEQDASRPAASKPTVSPSDGAGQNIPDFKDPYERFIWENRQKFGALSWSGLLRYGRGLVLMDARQWPDEAGQDINEAANEAVPTEGGTAQREARLGYLPEGRIAALSQTAQKKDAIRLLRTYNPREEIIVNVLRADGGGSFFQVALTDCPPPEAYRKLMGREDFQPKWKEPDT
jgi:hypothetical protein